MNKQKNKFARALIACWKEIAISDKALIIIMAILLLQCIYNLFTPEPITTNGISISVIVRTTIAAIFGYFLSENFLNHEVIKSKNSNIIVPLNLEENNEESNSENCHMKDSSNITHPETKFKDYICNKTFQILIALTVCIISLLCLLIGNNFNLIPSGTNPSLIQLRDIISSCIGFLLGHSSNTNKI